MAKRYIADSFEKSGGTGANVLLDNGTTAPLPAGGGGGTKSFIATGTIAAGKTVGLRSDGTVELIDDVSVSNVVGSTYASPANGSGQNLSTIFDSTTNKFLCFFKDSLNGNVLSAVIGTVSGLEITFSSISVIDNSTISTVNNAVYDSVNNRFVIFYTKVVGSIYVYGVVCNASSGTSITVGTPVAVGTAGHYKSVSYYDSSQSKIAVFTNNSSATGQCRVATVSGTTMTLGTAVSFSTVCEQLDSACYYPSASKGIVFYRVNTTSIFQARATTITGTVPSFGGIYGYTELPAVTICSTYSDSIGKVIMSVTLYDEFWDDYLLYIITLNISGTTISASTTYSGDGLDTSGGYAQMNMDEDNNKLIYSYLAYNGSGYDRKLKIYNKSISNVFTFSNSVTFFASSSYGMSSVYDTYHDRFILTDATPSNVIQSTAFITSAVTTNVYSFIGISNQSISNASSGSVTIFGGVNELQTSLIPSSDYYVDYTGSVVTSPNEQYGRVLIGRALSSTDLLIYSMDKQ